MSSLTDTKIFLASHRGRVGSANQRQLSAIGVSDENTLIKTHAELDLKTQAAVHAFMGEKKPDIVILAAAKVGGIHANNTYPAEFIHENLVMEANFIHATHLTEVQNLLFLGSSCIYPVQASQSVSEDALLTGALEPYADGLMLSNFIVQALNGEPITVYGDGQQTRSFCYVDDLIDGFLKMMESDPSVTGPINLGNPSEFMIRELAEKTIAMTGCSLSLDSLPLPQDDPKQRQPDIRRARNLLGWERSVQLDEGLYRTVEYFRTTLPQLQNS